jgi:hypothetical protein
MNNVSLALDGAWRVLITSLVLGAGLPAMFAFGVRSLSVAADAQPGKNRARVRPIARGVAILCFVIVLSGVALGITYIVASGFGKTLSFEHIYPTLVSKK